MKNLEYHHTALTRGYIRKNHSKTEEYNGKYGVGIIKHIPNCEGSPSNRYHRIEYWIEKKGEV